jgi:hypothetical protein
MGLAACTFPRIRAVLSADKNYSTIRTFVSRVWNRRISYSYVPPFSTDRSSTGSDLPYVINVLIKTKWHAIDLREKICLLSPHLHLVSSITNTDSYQLSHKIVPEQR